MPTAILPSGCPAFRPTQGIPDPRDHSRPGGGVGEGAASQEHLRESLGPWGPSSCCLGSLQPSVHRQVLPQRKQSPGQGEASTFY